MKTLKLTAWAFLAILATDLPAQAAWNNVFQPTLFGRRTRTTTNYCCPAPAPVIAQSPVFVAPPAPACNTCNSPPPAPVQQCTTNYVQRSFYQPVTTMESRSFYEPVTTMQTSFYYEPVTTMHTSFFMDPCSCCMKAQQTPVTSYRLRQQSCPVQSWVQRCAQVPVTSYKQVFFLEPQTTCCNTTPGAPIATPACPSGNCGPTQAPPQLPSQTPAPSYSSPQPPAPSYSPPPVIDQPRPAPSGPNVGSSTPTHYSPAMTTSHFGNGNWQPVVTLGAPQTGDLVQGQVVRNDRSPRANTQVLFVNAVTGARHDITTNDAGRFSLPLSAGNYHVFLATSNGAASYHSRVDVNGNQANLLNIVN